MSLALYRKYRPSVFADVIGQEHVTVPLSNALESGRTHHAYLFSGPRGCGKTSSARIMARSLNCEKGPTPNPCGECQSCKDLVANGPGSLDVIELDAATHGLVDDARDLRDKAFFAPVQSRYKIYIIDEVHMLVGAGSAGSAMDAAGFIRMKMRQPCSVSLPFANRLGIVKLVSSLAMQVARVQPNGHGKVAVP